MKQIYTNLFWPPNTKKVPPYGNFFLCLIVDFDRSKEVSWYTEGSAKNHSSLQYTVYEKIKNNRKNGPKNDNKKKCSYSKKIRNGT